MKKDMLMNGASPMKLHQSTSAHKQKPHLRLPKCRDKFSEGEEPGFNSLNKSSNYQRLKVPLRGI